MQWHESTLKEIVFVELERLWILLHHGFLDYAILLLSLLILVLNTLKCHIALVVILDYTCNTLLR